MEPYLPTPQLVLVGHGPVIEALETLGRAAGYSVVPLHDASAWARLDALGLGRRASVVVATHADSDEDALERVLRSKPATSASSPAGSGPRRSSDASASAAWRPIRLGRLKAPAGAGPRRRHAGGDRHQHPGGDRPAPPRRQDAGGRARGRDCHADGSHRSDLRHDGRDRHRPPSLGGRRARRISAVPAARRRSNRRADLLPRALRSARSSAQTASAATSSRSVARSWMVRASAVSITSRAASGHPAPPAAA